MMGKGCHLKHLLAKRFLSFMHLEPQGGPQEKKREHNSIEGVEYRIILIFPFLSLIILLIKITIFHKKNTCLLECGTVFNKGTFLSFSKQHWFSCWRAFQIFSYTEKKVLFVNFPKTGVLDLLKVNITQSSQSEYFLGQWGWCYWWIPLYCLSPILLHSVNVTIFLSPNNNVLFFNWGAVTEKSMLPCILNKCLEW